MVLKRAGHALSSATQLAGDEEWALLPSAQQIYLAMETKVSKNQKEKRDESKTGMQRSTDDVISGPGGWSPLTFLRGHMRATGQDSAPGETRLGRG